MVKDIIITYKYDNIHKDAVRIFASSSLTIKESIEAAISIHKAVKDLEDLEKEEIARGGE